MLSSYSDRKPTGFWLFPIQNYDYLPYEMLIDASILQEPILKGKWKTTRREPETGIQFTAFFLQ